MGIHGIIPFMNSECLVFWSETEERECVFVRFLLSIMMMPRVPLSVVILCLFVL